jgi:hypothetical protein
MCLRQENMCMCFNFNHRVSYKKFHINFQLLVLFMHTMNVILLATTEKCSSEIPETIIVFPLNKYKNYNYWNIFVDMWYISDICKIFVSDCDLFLSGKCKLIQMCVYKCVCELLL